MWAQLLILFTVISFRRSKLRSLAAVLSSSRRRRNGATAVVGETVWRRLRQCRARQWVPGRKAHKSQRGPVQASIGVVRCNVRGAATLDAVLVIEDKRELAVAQGPLCTLQEIAAVLDITQYAAATTRVRRLL